MTDIGPTPPGTLRRARRWGRRNGLHHVYVGNVHDVDGSSTYCPGCGDRVIERDWHLLGDWRLTDEGRCRGCGTAIAGRFDGPPGRWGRRRVAVRLGRGAEQSA